MSDLEYDILNELYFLIHYKELSKILSLTDYDLKPILMKLAKKGWLRCYTDPDEEINDTQVDLEVEFRNYYYLATKDGMKAHIVS